MTELEITAEGRPAGGGWLRGNGSGKAAGLEGHADLAGPAAGLSHLPSGLLLAQGSALLF